MSLGLGYCKLTVQVHIPKVNQTGFRLHFISSKSVYVKPSTEVNVNPKQCWDMGLPWTWGLSWTLRWRQRNKGTRGDPRGRSLHSFPWCRPSQVRNKIKHPLVTGSLIFYISAFGGINQPVVTFSYREKKSMGINIPPNNFKYLQNYL